MARNDGVDRTTVRHMRLNKDKIINAEHHNERQKENYVNQDIVPERTSLNVHYKQPSSRYSDMFEQMVKEGIISTRGLKPDADTYGELIFDVNSAYFHNHGGYEYAKRFFEEAYKAAIQIVGGEQYIFSAVMHADERNRAMSEALGQNVYHYHLHVVYVPVVEKQILWSKRCKDISLVGTVKETIMQVSMSKKWESKPAIDQTTGKPLRTFTGKAVLKKSYSQLQDDFFHHMINAGYSDIERGERGSSEEHLTVTQFKVLQEEKRLEQIQEAANIAQDSVNQALAEKEEAEKQAIIAEEKIKEIAPKLKNIEKLAAEFSGDPNELLPEAGVLESAKNYREKKAMSLFARIVKVLRGLYNSYLDLLNKHKNMEKAYNEVINRNKTLSDRITFLNDNQKKLAAKAAGFDTLCKEYGRDYIVERVKAAREKENMNHNRPQQKSRQQGVAI